MHLVQILHNSHSRKDSSFIAPFFCWPATSNWNWAINISFRYIFHASVSLSFLSNECYVLWLVVKYLSMAIKTKQPFQLSCTTLRKSFEANTLRICITLNMKRVWNVWLSFDLLRPVIKQFEMFWRELLRKTASSSSSFLVSRWETQDSSIKKLSIKLTLELNFILSPS